MIGRVLCAAFLGTALAVGPVWAATPPAPTDAAGVTWYGNGVIGWQRIERRTIAPKTITRFNSAVEPGSSKILARGSAGLRVLYIQYRQRDGGRVHAKILSSVVIRPAKPRIVAEGVGSSTLAAFEARGISQMTEIAHGAMMMLATAYTAGSAGGSGMTAIGRRAGYGIVAVDPRIIPLGTRLYIPGYGIAVAGDTGGDIVGRRIDLGFDTLGAAMAFGRRAVTVYRLK
ncbi:MAG TPA: 3D domain-containing protein [Candidatus Cybelea sp.]|nr:3D domain-containing protein [Candidatus Cybelea sp.]